MVYTRFFKMKAKLNFEIPIRLYNRSNLFEKKSRTVHVIKTIIAKTPTYILRLYLYTKVIIAFAR
jgi:hypothetical protein